MYSKLGISEDVVNLSKKVEIEIKPIFEKIDEFKGMVELAHHFELISDKEKGELTNLILNDALLIDKYFKKN